MDELLKYISVYRLFTPVYRCILLCLGLSMLLSVCPFPQLLNGTDGRVYMKVFTKPSYWSWLAVHLSAITEIGKGFLFRRTSPFKPNLRSLRSVGVELTI